MRHEVKYQPSYALAFIDLDPGESIQAEAGAMVSMSSAIEMETSTRGGLLSGLRRSVLGGESFFINTFRAEREAGQVTVAPALPGDIIALELTGQTTLLVQSGSFLAATEGVDVDTKWGGAKSFFSSEGLFLLRCTGQGTIWLSSYGRSTRSTSAWASRTPSTLATWSHSTTPCSTTSVARAAGSRRCSAARGWW